MLSGVSLFAGCSKKELGRIARAGDEITLPAGKVITEEGEPGHEAFVVLDGEVTVKRNNRKVSTLGSGSVIGELALLDNGPRTATSICATECELFVIDRRRFQALLDDVPTLSHKLMRRMAEWIRVLDSKVYG